MRVITDPDHLPSAARGAAVALGNFDGVHPGHQAVIAEAAARARATTAPLGVVTFEPHPRRLFRPDDPPFRLTDRDTRRRQLSRLGVDVVFELTFDAALSGLSAAEFAGDILARRLQVGWVVVGHDFQFGRGRGGNPALLASLGRGAGFEVVVVEPVAGHDGERISSSRIRDLITGGEVGRAAIVLGRPWEIAGPVRRGDQRGRTIGFPTLNLAMGDFLRPRYGVYAVRAGLGPAASAEPAAAEDGPWDWHLGVANVGRRPTLDGLREWLEVHLFDFAGDAYGRMVRVQFIDFLRAEQRFADIDALRTQIVQDCQEAARRLSGHPLIALPFP